MSSLLSRRLMLCLWWLAILLTVCLSVYGRRLQNRIVSVVDPHWFAVAVITALLVVLALIYRRAPGTALMNWVLGGAALLLIAGGIAVYSGVLAPVEAVHFLVFSCFGWLSASVFGPVYGAGAVIGLAVGDEVLQYFLPDRVGDLHDVAINMISGIIGLLLQRR